MNTTSQFTSNFWNIYIAVIVVVSFICLFWLLLSQNKIKAPRKGEDVKTMGHSWDGIEEYNNPLPRWWFYLFLLTLLFGIAYLVLYPGLGDYKGVLNWTSHKQYEHEVTEANKQYGKIYAKFAKMPIEEVAKNSDARKMGKNMFDTYCIQCHGSDAKGSRGFPNLTDNDWLWGGKPEQIQETIEKGRIAMMPSWGPALGEDRVRDVANYVMSLSKPKGQYDEDRAARGDVLFHGGPANCFSCHGDKGQGIQGLGPNLTDNTWLWGGTQKAIIDTITNGHHNQMPAWAGFLDQDKIHILTAYVWGLSNNGNASTEVDNKQTITAKTPSSVDTASKSTSEPVVANTNSSVAEHTEVDKANVPEKEARASENEMPTNKASVSVENGVTTFYFASGRDDVSIEAEKIAAEAVKAGKAGKILTISGFTDSTGSATFNKELSKKRAKAVRSFLEAQGVPSQNIKLLKPSSVTGSKGSSEEGRRVEVRVEN